MPLTPPFPAATLPSMSHTHATLQSATPQQQLAAVLKKSKPGRFRITPVYQLDESDYLKNLGPGGEGARGECCKCSISFHIPLGWHVT